MLKFHNTKHFSKRISERNLSVEHAKSIVRSPDSQKLQRNGTHGGKIYRFAKTLDGITVVVVAEIKDRNCWLLTSYEES